MVGSDHYKVEWANFTSDDLVENEWLLIFEDNEDSSHKLPEQVVMNYLYANGIKDILQFNTQLYAIYPKNGSYGLLEVYRVSPKTDQVILHRIHENVENNWIWERRQTN